MSYITRRQVRGQDVILLEEIIDQVVDGVKFRLLLKAGIVKAYKIIPASIIIKDPREFITWGDKILYKDAQTIPESLQEIPWDAVSVGMFVLWADIEPLLLSEPVEQQADQGPVDNMPVEKYILPLIPDVDIIWEILKDAKPQNQKDAFKLVNEYLEKHPESRIDKKWISVDCFISCGLAKFKRNCGQYIIQACCRANGYEIGTTAIGDILKKYKK